MEDRFKDAVERVKKLTKRPSDSELLELYAFYKQETVGDVIGERPGLLDLKGRKKFDSWAKVRGTNKNQAMERYIELVDQLELNG